MKYYSYNFYISFITLMFLIVFSKSTFAQVNLPNTNSTTEGFNSMGTNTTNALPISWRINTSQNFATGTRNLNYAADSGNPGSNPNLGTYNFGSGSGSNDRAPGVIGQNNYLIGYYKNTTGKPISSITVNYDVERYRRQNQAAYVSLSYSTSLNGDSNWINVGNTLTINGGNNNYNWPRDTYAQSNIINFDTPIPSNGTFYLSFYINTSNGNYQGIAIDNVSLNILGCNDIFYDTGGNSTNYSNNENYTITLYPNNSGEAIELIFTSFSTENGYDGMLIYDGDSTSSPLISSGSTFNQPTCPNGAWTGSNTGTFSANGRIFTSTHPTGALTITFMSDGTINSNGWIANVNCTTCLSVNANTSQNVICEGQSVTLTATSNTTGYTYNWYTNWDENSQSGTFIGSGSSIITWPTESTAYRLVASKAGCPQTHDYAVVAVTTLPTEIELNPTYAYSCNNETTEINIISGGVISPTALYENFNNLSTLSWLTGSNHGSEGNWSWVNPNTLPNWGSSDNTPFVIITTPFTSGNLVSNLSSIPISLQDFTSATLTFNDRFGKEPNDNSSGRVQLSIDGGETWTSIATITAARNWGLRTIDISSYAGNPYLLIRFNYTTTFNYFSTMFWAIDNVAINGVTIPTTITWSPITGLYTDPDMTNNYNGGHATTLYASPSNTTEYTITASNSLGCSTTKQVTIEKSDKDWLGINNNWANATNWTPIGIPTSNHCVNIPSTSAKPIIPVSYDAFAKSIKISNGGGLTISSNSSLTVKNSIINNSSGDDFILQSDANLLQTNPLAVNIGNMRAERFVQNMNNILPTHMDYVYWSSPVTGQAIHDGTNSIFSPGTPVNRNYEYRESNDYFYPTPDQTFKKGKGYAIRAETGINPETGQNYVNGYNKTYKFSGIPNNGTIISEETLKYTDNVHGHNLVGNPYPSNLNLVDFLTTNSSKIEYAAYFWTNNTTTPYQSGTGYTGNSYATFNGSGGVAAGAGPSGYNMTDVPNGIVKVGQGFLVKAKPAGNNQNLVFENNSRSAGAGSFYQKNTEDRFWLTLTSPDQMNNMMLIGYNEDATDGFEMMFDAPLVTESSDAIYSLLNDQKLAINGLAAPFSRNDIIPIGFKSFKNGVHTIQLFNAEGVFTDHDIFIKDKYRKTIHNLKQSPFEFKSGAGEFNDRFEIVFKRTNISASSSTKSSLADKPGSIIISSKNNSIFASVEKENIIQIDVYDLFGKLLFQSKNINSNTYLTPQQFKNQIVFVNVITESGLRESKKIIFD